MAAQAGQLALYESATPARRPAHPAIAPAKTPAALCAGCREKEARYGFRQDERAERPRTLCFSCFRMELDRRRLAAEQLARGWNAEQVSLPLAETLQALDLRRRRAQIAARRAVA